MPQRMKPFPTVMGGGDDILFIRQTVADRNKRHSYAGFAKFVPIAGIAALKGNEWSDRLSN
jgi:hypothetical protein